MKPKENKHHSNFLNQEDLKNSGHQAPEGYFDSLDAIVFNKIFEEKLPNNTGFITPESYFDTIENTVLEKVKKKTKKTKTIHLRTRFKKTLISTAVAASFLIVFAIQYFSNNIGISFETIASSEIEQWIENGELELTNFDIVAIYDLENINESSFSSNFNNNDLIDYLDGSNIESLYIEND